MMPSSENIHHWLDLILVKVWSGSGAGLLLLFSTIVFAVVVSFVGSGKPRTFRNFMQYLWPKEILSHKSAKADFLFWLSRHAFMPLMVVPLTVSTVISGKAAHQLLVYVFGAPVNPPGPASTPMLLLFTLTMFFAYDLSYYIYHFLQHKIPILWELHKVHHSAEVMVGVTKDRIHPFDEIMSRWWDGIIPGFTYGIWLFFAIDPVELTIFGVSAYVLRQTIIMMDFVRHTHMKVSYGKWLNGLFICPHYHQLHHSVNPKHYDKNFGLALAIWDRMFGTMMVPKKGEDFEFGLINREAEDYRSFTKLHLVPMQKIYRMIRNKMSIRQKTAKQHLESNRSKA